MSIKNLFGNNDITLKLVSEANQKEAFKEIESDRNLKAISDILEEAQLTWIINCRQYIICRSKSKIT